MPTPNALLQQVQEVTRRALASGALAPIATQTRTVREGGIDFELRYIDALSKKDVERARLGDRPAGKTGAHNPFLPYEPELFVADANPGHVILLNKFPVIANHILLITREFVDQEAVVAPGDCVALARLMAVMDGVLFFNGGRTGGGSQPHRHFQLIPGTLPIEAALPRDTMDSPQQLPQLRFRHAFMPYRFDPERDPVLSGADLFESFQRCCAAVDVVEHSGKLSPYNLLMTREWLMVIPRTRECWEHEGRKISINALGFGGCLLVRSPELIDVVESAGVFSILRSVTE